MDLVERLEFKFDQENSVLEVMVVVMVAHLKSKPRKKSFLLLICPHIFSRGHISRNPPSPEIERQASQEVKASEEQTSSSPTRHGRSVW